MLSRMAWLAEEQQQLENTCYSSCAMERGVGFWLGKRGFAPFSSRCRGIVQTMLQLRKVQKSGGESKSGKSRRHFVANFSTFFSAPCAAELCQKVDVATKHTMKVWRRTWLLETDSFFQEFHIKKGRITQRKVADSITSKLWRALHAMLPTTVSFQVHKPKCREKNSHLWLTFYGFLGFSWKKMFFSIL